MTNWCSCDTPLCYARRLSWWTKRWVSVVVQWPSDFDRWSRTMSLISSNRRFGDEFEKWLLITWQKVPLTEGKFFDYLLFSTSSKLCQVQYCFFGGHWSTGLTVVVVVLLVVVHPSVCVCVCACVYVCVNWPSDARSRDFQSPSVSPVIKICAQSCVQSTWPLMRVSFTAISWRQRVIKTKCQHSGMQEKKSKGTELFRKQENFPKWLLFYMVSQVLREPDHVRVSPRWETSVLTGSLLSSNKNFRVCHQIHLVVLGQWPTWRAFFRPDCLLWEHLLLLLLLLSTKPQTSMCI